MTSTDFYTNNSFAVWAERHLVIDENEQGQVIVHCPDRDGNWYHIDCEESATNIVPTSCSCGKKDCKHQAVVASFYQRIYKNNTAENTTKYAAKQAAKVATPKVVVPRVSTLINQAVAASKITDLSRKGNLNTSRAFNLLR